MSTSFDLPDLELFTAGAVGEPGQRTFFIQVRAEGHVVSFKCEKQQVAALGTYLEGALGDLPAAEPGEVPDELELVEPVVAEWVVGSMGMAYDERSDRLVLLLEELVPEEEQEEGAGEATLGEGEAATARLHVSRAQAAAFVARAEDLVEAGRPTCSLCGLPMSPDGHTCPRTNGHGRP